MRVVLDTNAVVSALLFSGVSSKLVSLWENGSITPLLSREILDEYLQVLSYPKFQLSEEEVKELIQEEILENCILREKWQICGTNWTTHRFDAAANWIEGESVQAFG